MSIKDLQFLTLCHTFFKNVTQSFIFDFGSLAVSNESFLFFAFLLMLDIQF